MSCVFSLNGSTWVPNVCMYFSAICHRYVVPPSCQRALSNRPGVQPSYYSGIIQGGVRSGQRAEDSLDSEVDQ